MKSNKGDFKKGHIPWNKGIIKDTDERLNYKRSTKFKKGEHRSSKTEFKKGCKKSDNWYKAMEKRCGSENSSWKGGISLEPYPISWKNSLKESIRQRDDYICQECGTHQDELDKKLDVHHIDYNKENLNPDNLISLCRSCHTKTNTNRDYWIEYFKNICQKN